MSTNKTDRSGWRAILNPRLSEITLLAQPAVGDVTPSMCQDFMSMGCNTWVRSMSNDRERESAMSCAIIHFDSRCAGSHIDSGRDVRCAIPAKLICEPANGFSCGLGAAGRDFLASSTASLI